MQASWPSENLILGLLCARPMHGYELAQLAITDEALSAIWHLKRSEVYFLLGKLLKCGHIVAVGEEQEGGPARVIYAPSDAGRQALFAWLRTPEPRPRNMRSALLARAYLCLKLNPAIALELVAAQEKILAQWLADCKTWQTRDEMAAVVNHYRAAQVEAALGALAEVRELAQARVAAPHSNCDESADQATRDLVQTESSDGMAE